MELRWTEEAAADLERIADYLFEHAPEQAADLVRELYNAPAVLANLPFRGRPGKKKGRESLYFRRYPTSWSIESPATLSMLSEYCMAPRNGLRRRI